jgi:hypothetical protein
MAFRLSFKTLEQAQVYAVKKLSESKAKDGVIVGVVDYRVIEHGKNKGRYEINWLLDARKLMPVSAFD